MGATEPSPIIMAMDDVTGSPKSASGAVRGNPITVEMEGDGKEYALTFEMLNY